MTAQVTTSQCAWIGRAVVPLASGTNRRFSHLANTSATGRSTVFTVRVVECAELLAADLSTHAEQTRVRLTLTFGDVQRHLAQLAGHPPLQTEVGLAAPSAMTAAGPRGLPQKAYSAVECDLTGSDIQQRCRHMAPAHCGP